MVIEVQLISKFFTRDHFLGRDAAGRCRTCWVVLVVFAALASCSRTETGTIPATGRVHYKGSPVEGAEVALIPRDRLPGSRPARGVTNADGKFAVSSYFTSQVDTPGARPGHYLVTVSKCEPPAGMSMDQWLAAQVDGKAKVAPLRYVVPRKYSQVQTSGLSVVVKTDGNNHFEFELID